MKLRDFLYVTVLVPRVLLMQWDSTPEAQIDLQITQSGDRFVYNDIVMEPVEILDYPCLPIEAEEQECIFSGNE